jgi:hypothetical protein
MMSSQAGTTSGRPAPLPPRWVVRSGEVEPCINGRTVGIGAYFGQDVKASSIGC